MNTDWQKIAKAKEAARRQLRELPWVEKLEKLDKLRDRHLLLRQTTLQSSEFRIPRK